MSLRLIIEDDEGATTIVPLEAGAVTIGRQEGNTIQLTERNVSRRHARLAPAPEGWVIEDLNSYNGIRVNGIAIEGKVMLREGDVAQIGDYHLALCEDVDKKTLNLDRPVKAANDEEPLLVSSSSGLPRLTPTEIAELQRGYQADAAPTAPASAPRMTYPATARPAGQAQKGRIGVVVAAGGGVALLGLAIAFLLVRGGGSGGEPPQAQAPVPAVQTPPAPAMQNPAVAPGPPPTVNPTPIGTDVSALQDPSVDAGAADVEPIPDEENVDEAEVEPDRSDKDEPRTSRSSGTRTKAARRSKTSSSSSPPPPPPPVAPPPPGGSAVDANQLLKDARVASLKGSHDLAYELARKAYDAKRSPAALKVMGVAACKMGDVAKARAAYRKLSGANKEGLAKVCEGQGINL